MLSFLERKGQQVFERYGFSAEGDPAAGCPAVTQAKDYQPQVLETGRIASALEAVCQDMRQRGLAEALVAEVERQAPAAVYESTADTVNIHIDEVGVKKQKAQRSEPMTVSAVTLSDPPGPKRPMVQNTVARIEPGVYAHREQPAPGAGLCAGISVEQRPGGPAVVILYRRAALAAERHCRLFCLARHSIVATGLVPRGEEVSRRVKPGLHGT